VMNQTESDRVERGAAHTMAEIAQQPHVWRQVSNRAATARDLTEPFVARQGVRVILTGAGTSAFAGQVLAPGLRRGLRRRIDAVPTTDIVANPAETLGEDLPTLLVSFARSGDSPESVAAAQLADQLLSDVHHLVLTCNRDGRLARRYSNHERARVVLMPEEANDKGFAMTSSFTGMTLAALLALDPSAEPGLAGRLSAIAEQVFSSWNEQARDLVGRGYQRLVYLGSGALKGLAHESALKALELTAGHMMAMGDSPLAFRHGPKSVLNDSTLAVLYLSNDPHTRAYDLDVLHELRRSLGDDHVLAVTADRGDEVSTESAWVLPDSADLPDAALALPAVLCAQLIALHSSLALGLSVDNPFPSGEVNRVVQGVRIHAFGGPST
jgi:tagatose-6-phosphate ketose/aldose isomerase